MLLFPMSTHLRYHDVSVLCHPLLCSTPLSNTLRLHQTRMPPSSGRLRRLRRWRHPILVVF